MSTDSGAAVAVGDVAERVSTSEPIDAWLDGLAGATGAPGGGAACGVMLGVSAALLRMVAAYTTNDERAAGSARRLADLRREALRASERDGLRSAELGAALAAPKDAGNRDRRIGEGAIAGAESSAELGRIGVALADELRVLADIGNPSLAADVAVAAEALAASLAGASINLRADLQLANRHRTSEDGTAARIDELIAAVDSLAAARVTASAIADAQSAKFGPP